MYRVMSNFVLRSQIGLQLLEDLDKEVETITENIKMLDKESVCYFELKTHKPWFEEE
jgi:hypothetical protein